MATLDQLAWALVNIMDGIKDHEIMDYTGLSEDECKKIVEIRRKAKEIVFGRVVPTSQKVTK